MTGDFDSHVFRPDLYFGHCVLISGGTSGIGLGIARAFLDLGAQVHITGTNQDKLSALGAELASDRASFGSVDVTDLGAVQALVAGLPQIDVLVNAAGIFRHDEHSHEGFAAVMDTNLSGTARLCLEARPKLAASKGNIINIASMYSFFGDATGPAYAASKGAVVQLTKSLALAYGADGVRVNAIAPGWIETAMTESTHKKDRDDDHITGRLAIKQWGRPRDIAGGAVFLASPAASYITGVVLAIDGGYSCA